MGILCVFSPEKFPSGRQIVEKGAHLDLGSGRFPAIFYADNFSPVDNDLGSGERVRFARRETEFGNTGNAGNGFPAKAEGMNCGKVFFRFDLGRCVSFQTHERVVTIHSAAVIGHTDQSNSAALDTNLDIGGSGVDAVFDEFFRDGSGAFDDFAGGNLAGEGFGEETDFSHEIEGAYGDKVGQVN